MEIHNITGVPTHSTYMNIPVEALNYVVALIHNSMSTTHSPMGGKTTYLLALNMYPATTVQGGISWSTTTGMAATTRNLENHSDCLQGMDKFTTSHYCDLWTRLRLCERDDDTCVLQEPPGGHDYNLRPGSHLLREERQEHVAIVTTTRRWSSSR